MSSESVCKSSGEWKCLNFLRRKRRFCFCLALVLQLILLTGLFLPRLILADTGREVVFNTVPVDPWDMFRGDYVTMKYDFSTVALNKGLKRGEKVYVTLSKDSTGRWKVVKLTRSLPVLASGQIVLKGEYESGYQKTARVRYGLERVYVEEGVGRKLSSKDRLRVVVAVDNKGNALIKRVSLNDREYYRFKLI